MIGKQVKGRGFRGALNYVLNPAKGMLIGGNMDGTFIRDLAKEFAESRRLNPNLKRPVYHVSLSLCPGEYLGDLDWNQVADCYLKKMGFKYSQYVVARHIDKEHDHIHIIASRIDLNGKTVSDSLDYKRSEEAIRGLEKDFRLKNVISSHHVERRGLTTGELRLALKTHTPSARMQLQAIIDQEAKRSLTMSHFVKELERRGVKIIPNMAGNGSISGISFSLNAQIMKGSDLGRGFTFLGLQKRGIHYDPLRDNDVLASSRKAALNNQDQSLGNPLMAKKFKF